MSWASRIHRPPGSPPLAQVQTAAENLAGQAGMPPSKVRVIFQTVVDAAIITSALTATTLAAVHLWKTLHPKHQENTNSLEPAAGGAPPRRHGSHATAVADGHDGHERHGHRRR